MKKLYEFYLDYGRMGELTGLFIEEEEKVQEAIGHEIYYGEVLGKHSEVYEDLTEGQLTVKSEDQEFIQKLIELLGWNISGFNPVDIYFEHKEEGRYDET